MVPSRGCIQQIQHVKGCRRDLFCDIVEWFAISINYPWACRDCREIEEVPKNSCKMPYTNPEDPGADIVGLTDFPSKAPSLFDPWGTHRSNTYLSSRQHPAYYKWIQNFAQLRAIESYLKSKMQLQANATRGANLQVFNVLKKHSKKRRFNEWSYMLNDIRVKYTASQTVLSIKTYLT